jgi:hypothetical protein
VARYFVPGVPDLKHQSRMFFRYPTQNEKRSRNGMAIQQRENFLGLPLYSGRHCTPPVRVRRNSQLARVKVLFEINADRICHRGELAAIRDRILRRMTTVS